MKKIYFFVMLAAMLFVATGAMARKKNLNPEALQGIWQLCHYVSEDPNAPGVLKPSNTFKVLSEDGKIVNFTVRPGQAAIITGYGTYKILTENTYKESIEKNIHLPMLDNADNLLEFQIEDNVMHLKFYIEKDLNGNELDTWFYETWQKLDMPDSFPEDIIR